ncbi:MAG: histidinol dehydrogenase [Bacteroidales bacterium]
MQIFDKPDKKKWEAILARPKVSDESIQESVREILKDVKKNGDKALKKYTKALDGAEVTEIQLNREELADAENKIDKQLKKAINEASENIKKFHNVQMPKDVEIETTPGILCRQRSVAIENIGIYIPGGTAPLFSSVLMMAIPAQLAGCKKIIIATPPNADGAIDPTILYAAKVNGIEQIYRIGGAQAIAAMAYGTESVPRVDKIFGPGNSYVTLAKQLVSMEGTAIDLPAGPSEVLIIADESTSPSFAATDLLAQAEHGPDSQVLLLTKQTSYAGIIQKETEKLLETLPRKDVTKQALKNSRIIVLNSDEEMMEMSNWYAPEHLILATENADELADKVTNAGSVFIGPYTPESLGDYASGTNHVLPTGGFAKAFEGVNINSFFKKITYQKATYGGLKQIAATTIAMAEAEGLEAHKQAVNVRLKSSTQQKDNQ